MNEIIQEYSKKGYAVIRNRDISFLLDLVKETLKCEDLEQIHNSLDEKNLNEERLNLSRRLSTKECREYIYSLVKEVLNDIVGRELVVQKNINTTIHIPKLDNNITPLHSDTLCGNSPYETVVWIPMCKIRNSQSMYVFDKTSSREIEQNLDSFKDRNEILKKYGSQCEFLNLTPGDILIFSSTIFHGSVQNNEDISRVSINLRFKNLHSPEGEKKLGEYFLEFRKSIQTTLAQEYIDDH